jgi:hypothetical protein
VLKARDPLSASLWKHPNAAILLALNSKEFPLSERMSDHPGRLERQQDSEQPCVSGRQTNFRPLSLVPTTELASLLAILMLVAGHRMTARAIADLQNQEHHRQTLRASGSCRPVPMRVETESATQLRR